MGRPHCVQRPSGGQAEPGASQSAGTPAAHVSSGRPQTPGPRCPPAALLTPRSPIPAAPPRPGVAFHHGNVAALTPSPPPPPRSRAAGPGRGAPSLLSAPRLSPVLPQNRSPGREEPAEPGQRLADWPGRAGPGFKWHRLGPGSQAGVAGMRGAGVLAGGGCWLLFWQVPGARLKKHVPHTI